MQRESEDQGKDDGIKKELRIDYDPLERLLICLIDGHKNSYKTRKNKLRDSYRDITGRRIARVDEPDSAMAKALFKITQTEAKMREAQDIYNADGTPKTDELIALEEVEEEKLFALAKEIYAEGTNELEYLKQRIIGTSNHKIVSENPHRYMMAVQAWGWWYDSQQETQLFKDMKQIAEILAKYDIPMKFDKAFWRVV